MTLKILIKDALLQICQSCVDYTSNLNIDALITVKSDQGDVQVISIHERLAYPALGNEFAPTSMMTDFDEEMFLQMSDASNSVNDDYHTYESSVTNEPSYIVCSTRSDYEGSNGIDTMMTNNICSAVSYENAQKTSIKKRSDMSTTSKELNAFDVSLSKLSRGQRKSKTVQPSGAQLHRHMSCRSRVQRAKLLNPDVSKNYIKVEIKSNYEKIEKLHGKSCSTETAETITNDCPKFATDWESKGQHKLELQANGNLQNMVKESDKLYSPDQCCTDAASPENNLLNVPNYLSTLEMDTARILLSCSGPFLIVRQLQRHYASLKDIASSYIHSLFDKMTVSRSNPYHIGQFMRWNARSIFYKAPPELLDEIALQYYGFTAEQYSTMYHKQSRFSSIKDVHGYSRKVFEMSPYNNSTMHDASYS